MNKVFWEKLPSMDPNFEVLTAPKDKVKLFFLFHATMNFSELADTFNI